MCVSMSVYPCIYQCMCTSVHMVVDPSVIGMCISTSIGMSVGLYAC